MGILNVDNIQPVGGGTTITLNSSEINVGAGITFESNGQAIYAGIITATSYRGDGSQLTGISVDSTKIETGNTKVETIDTGSNGNVKVTTEGSERLIIDSDGNIAFNRPNTTVGDNQASSATATPKRIVFNNTFSNGYTDSSLKLYLQNENTTRLGFTVGPSYDLQYHSSGSATNSKHTFYTHNTERARITSSGLNVTGVVSFTTGHTYKTLGYDPTLSPIQGDRNTWFYTSFDQSASVSGSTIVNLATGPIKVSDTLPVSNMTRQSFGGSTAMYHASTTTGGNAVSTDFSAADPFAAKTHGLTMGCLVYVRTEGNSGAGVMHYGANGNDEHFYIRFKYNYNSEDHGFSIGKDNDGSDAWHNVMKGSDVTGDTWYYIAVRISQSGSIDFSLNGNPFYTVRTKQNTVRPGNARFGLAGDPYNDNASKHRYATAFWYRGLLSDQQIRDEYEWAKTIWTGASLP